MNDPLIKVTQAQILGGRSNGSRKVNKSLQVGASRLSGAPPDPEKIAYHKHTANIHHVSEPVLISAGRGAAMTGLCWLGEGAEAEAEAGLGLTDCVAP